MNELSCEENNYSNTARKYSLSKTHIINIFDKYFKKPQINKDDIKVLCIDENRIIRNYKERYSYQLIVFDPKTKKIMDIKKDRKKEFVYEALNEYKNLNILSMDLWRTYRNVALDINPKITIIPDNFHLVRLLCCAFDRSRRKVCENLKIPKSKNWRILSKAKSKLDEKGLEILKEMLEKIPELKILHETKEKAYETFSKISLNEYKEKIKELKDIVYQNELEEFYTPLNTIDEWSSHIENLYKNPDISNGILERINSKIKYIKRSARGFKNMERMKNIVMYKVNNVGLI